MAAAFVLGEVCAAGYRRISIFLGLLFAAVLLFSEEIQEIRRSGKKGMLLLVLCALCLLGGIYRMNGEQEKRAAAAAEAAGNEELLLRARVDWVKQTQYGYALTLSQAELLTQSGSPVLEKLRLYAYTAEAAAIMPGDKILAEATLRDFEPARNPGEFDSLWYYRSLGFHCAADITEIRAVHEAVLPVYRCLAALRERLQAVFARICTPEANGIFQAMLLGEKSELAKETRELYSAGGISHILAISGLHIAVIGMGMYRMIRRLGGFTFSGLLAGTLLLLYVLLTGSSVSACRAGIMFVIQLCSFPCRRSYDMLSAAAFTLLLLLWDNPMYLFHSGCQLSFGAVLAIGIVYPVLAETAQAESPLHKAFLSGLSVSAVTFPMLAWSFYELSPYSLFLNLLVIPCMTLVMLSGILGGLCGMGEWYLTELLGGSFRLWSGRFFIALGQEILKLYEWLCECMALLPGNRIITGKPELWVIGGYYLLLTAGVLLLHRQMGKRRIGTPLLAGALALLTILLCLRIQRGISVSFLSVSQGDGIYIETPELTLLVDGGSSDKRNLYENSLRPFLKSKGAAALDYAIVSHPDEDHVSGLRELLKEKEITVKVLLLPAIEESMQDEAYLELAALAEQGGTEVRMIAEGDVMRCGRLELSCLHPGEGLYTHDRNEYSVVLEVSYGEFDMLLTGDISERVERQLLPYLRQSEKTYEVLKVAHHGSGSSSCQEFLEAVRPELAVISCGENNRYGHPSGETLDRLEGLGSRVLRTDLQGSVIVEAED